MNGFAARLLPYLLSFFSSFCIMILELMASRLVARHVGASLMVWTSVIGIILAGICLGNVLGGRLADRVEPRRAIGPLYALGAFLTLSCLWVNGIVGWTPGLDTLPWDARTALVVTLDFLVPATVLGMIGPVVAKMAVERSRKAGTAIGDVYFWGAIGSITGTFLAGFVLMYVAPVSSIVTIVAAALALLSAFLLGGAMSLAIGVVAAGFLGASTVPLAVAMVPAPGVTVGSQGFNAVALVGHGLTVLLALIALGKLAGARSAFRAEAAAPGSAMAPADRPNVRLTDLAALSFIASLAFMAMEMAAGRILSKHLGSSLYGWTSIIGVLLGGLSVGNWLGGKIADRVRDERQASWLFLFASVMTVSILFLETPPNWFRLRTDIQSSVLSEAITWTTLRLPNKVELPMAWPARVLLVTALMFFLPAVSMGTVSPVVAKLAVDRVRKSQRTGQAIGQVYAWGMVGSLLGTFLAGFFLIDFLGTKGLVLVLAALLAFSATALGSVWHAAWAGIPLGLCVIAFAPFPWFVEQGQNWGIREKKGDPSTTEDDVAYIDESDYYFIKVTNEPVADGQKRTLVLDNLIHGYFILDHPERLDYDYEHIYALVSDRAARARGVARKAAAEAPKPAAAEGDGAPAAAPASPLKTLFLGGGAYTYQRYMQHTYPGTEVDVAEIDPAVTEANHVALGLPRDTPIRTAWGDARQFVERNQGSAKYDLVYGDAFNDFSVPWHLTTREFNDKLASMMTDDGIYMINIIDAYESDEVSERKAEKRITREDVTDEARKAAIRAEVRAKGRRYGGFVGAWVNTARLTFPHVYVFGTGDEPGNGLRETFVVVASKKPLEVDDLGSRDDDPRFFQDDEIFEPKPFEEKHLEALRDRSRGIVLTDDYAPVENLLAPVAETRGDD